MHMNVAILSGWRLFCFLAPVIATDDGSHDGRSASYHFGRFALWSSVAKSQSEVMSFLCYVITVTDNTLYDIP